MKLCALTLLTITCCATIALSAPTEPAPVRKNPLPKLESPRNADDVKKRLVEMLEQSAKAVQLEEKNGTHHMHLADVLLEFATQADNLVPLTRPVEAKPDLSEARRNEILSQINGLCTEYVGVKPMLWLIENCHDAEPLIAERLRKGPDYEKPRLQKVLVAHWKELAIEHYAQAHNLNWKKDLAAYNPFFGPAWDDFTSLRSGKLYLQLTALDQDEKTQEQSQRIRETFAAVRKKQTDYRGPVR